MIRRLTPAEYQALLRDKAPQPDPDCEHEYTLRPSDNPRYDRGWAPAICGKCGKNLDVDSSG